MNEVGILIISSLVVDSTSTVAFIWEYTSRSFGSNPTVASYEITHAVSIGDDDTFSTLPEKVWVGNASSMIVAVIHVFTFIISIWSRDIEIS